MTSHIAAVDDLDLADLAAEAEEGGDISDTDRDESFHTVLRYLGLNQKLVSEDTNGNFDKNALRRQHNIELKKKLVQLNRFLDFDLLLNPNTSISQICYSVALGAISAIQQPQHEQHFCSPRCVDAGCTLEHKPTRLEHRIIGAYICSSISTAIYVTSKMPTQVEKKNVQSLKKLGPAEVSLILSKLHNIVLISPGKENHDEKMNMLAIYDDDENSPYWGTYRTSTQAINDLAFKYEADLSIKDLDEIHSRLRSLVPTVVRGTNRDLVPLNNGVFNYKTKTLLDHSPDYIFTAKSPINYNPDAENVVLDNGDGTTWDVLSWVKDLFFMEYPENPSQEEIDHVDNHNKENAGLDHLIWQIIGATLRPYVSWNKAAFFYAVSGNNGKGTLIELMRNVVGINATASIPMADFSKDFALEPLMSCNAILVDENDVGVYLDRAAELKAVITNDVISINRKYQAPIAYRFYGFMVQCLNEMPQLRDKSESLYRRQLFVPFSKSFTGKERKYIKDDYIKRQDVLEFIVKYVLTKMDDYYSFNEPEASKQALGEFRHDNDPVRSFWEEFSEQFVWDLLPGPFLYDLFRAWMLKTNPSAKPISQNRMLRDLRSIISTDPRWRWTNATRSAGHIKDPEPLIVEFDVEGWIDRSAGRNKQQAASPKNLKSTYRGVLRV